jgi:hypothetical protein
MRALAVLRLLPPGASLVTMSFSAAGNDPQGGLGGIPTRLSDLLVSARATSSCGHQCPLRAVVGRFCKVQKEGNSGDR